ncbi:MAG: cell division protein ZapA [Rikenellaceae bacterium]|nr:cell division protein ZapA [Rikenellaceae bacterium]
MTDKIRIVLKIAGREYPLTVERKDEEKYRKAAKNVNELVTLYSKSYSADFENYLAMTSLQLALANIKYEGSGEMSPVTEELKELEQELEDLINKKQVL